MYYSERVDLKVIAVFNEEGTIRPLKVLAGGGVFPVQQILDSRRARVYEKSEIERYEFKVLVCNQVKMLYLDIKTNVWYSIRARDYCGK